VRRRARRRLPPAIRVLLTGAVVLLAAAGSAAHVTAEGELPTAVRTGGAAPLGAGDAFDAAAFERAVRRVPEAGEPMPGVRALVVPHHWAAGSLIVAGLRDLEATAPWRRVVLLSPDHRHAGQRIGTTSDQGWATPYGRMGGDEAAVASLSRTGLVASRGDLVAREHGIAGLVPALAGYLGDARLVPLALRPDATPGEVRSLGVTLANLMGPDTVLVASVDLAHGVPPAVARRHDAETLAALADLDMRSLRVWGDEHLDGRMVMAVVMAAMRRAGATRFVVRERSDGSQLPGYPGGAVTSYALAYYTTDLAVGRTAPVR